MRIVNLASKQTKPINLFAHIFLLFGGLILVYPLIFMILAGFMTKQEFQSTIFGYFPIAKQPTLSNYISLFSPGSENSMIFLNTLIRTVYTTFFATITAFFGGYAFGRFKFRWKETIFLMLLFMQMLPGTASIIPMYIEFARWPFAGGNFIFTGGKGILDTWWVYLIGGPAINIFGTFLVRQSMEKLPYDFEESAKMDGAGLLRTMIEIVMPMQKPILAFIAITTSIATWNDWVVPFFYTDGANLKVLAGEIARLTSVAGLVFQPDYPLIITLSLGLVIPCMIIFFFFQKYIVLGLASTGIKG
jgi:multiple sugar transport system permease protein